MKNLFIKFLLAVLRPFFGSTPIKDNVLVVSTTGLGDTMWAIPPVRALKAQGKKIVLLTGPYGSKLLQNCPYPEKIYTTSHTPIKKIVSLFTALKKHRFEEIFIFHASQRPLFPMLSLLNPKALHSFKGRNKGLDALCTHLIDKGLEHEITLRLRMIGAENSSSEMELFHPKEQTEEKRIALFPGSKDAQKRWPKEYFIELGDKLSHHEGYTLYVVGSRDEKAIVNEIAKQIPNATPLFTLPLDKTIQFIQSCMLCITNDSGPMHLAFAAKIPTIGLFSPTSPIKYGPLGVTNGMVIERRTPCSPCIRRKCKDNFCMRQISSETVYQEAKKWLK